MRLPFTKMHGLGNDFVVLDARRLELEDRAGLSRRLADRRFGVGCDQVLFLRASDRADFRMDIFNADGGRGEMCGNGIRCLARYVRDRGISGAGELRFETLAGLIATRTVGDLVEVDMGEPVFEGRRIPVDADGPIRERPLSLQGTDVRVTCLSMGNPHAVVFVDDAEACPVARLGPQVEHHAFFPQRVNTEFVEVLDGTGIRMRAWERGSGMTLACGTGACAAAVASHWTGRTGREIQVRLDGGVLQVRWAQDSNHVFLTGPAAEVFTGEYPA